MSRSAAIGGALLVGLALPVSGAGQDPGSRPSSVEEFDAPWPFPLGETSEYDVTFGPVRVGRARLAIEAVDTVRSNPTFRLAFELKGGAFFYKIDDRTVSWLASDPYRSLRFEQVLHEGGYRRHRRYELDHDAGTVLREDWDEAEDTYRPHVTTHPAALPPFALDEISILYLVRTLPLEVGRTYTFHNYFKEDGNPVVVEVLRRERVRVRAGRFDTVVIRPIIQTEGMFGEGGEAELYITDDDRRWIVQLKTRMKVGEINMFLREAPSDAT